MCRGIGALSRADEAKSVVAAAASEPEQVEIYAVGSSDMDK